MLERTLALRTGLFDDRHLAAIRLFNGFTEGFPGLVVDLYATSLLIHNLARPHGGLMAAVDAARDFYPTRLPWVQSIVIKTRHATSLEEKRGRLAQGTNPADRVQEFGVWYALDLLRQQDAGLYLDTRLLRRWGLDYLKGKTILNTFAYTGSLGVAALGGGANRVVQLDRNREHFDLARGSYLMNGFPVHEADFLVGDFFEQISRLKRAGEFFDCVFLDPPFCASSARSRVDLVKHDVSLINKVRQLLRDGGWLVAINNALFVSGRDYLSKLEKLCQDGYLQVETLLPVAEDCCGYPDTRQEEPSGGLFPADPAPFNHPTKIAVLRVKRK